LKIKKSLGEGGFGYVYLVKDKPTGKKYALKRVLCQDEQALQVPVQLMLYPLLQLYFDRRYLGARLS
jgi:serine/threonine protein kinase